MSSVAYFLSPVILWYIFFFRLQPCSMPWTQSIATRKRKPMFLSMPSTRCTYWKRRKWKKPSWRDRRRHEKKYTAWWARRTTRRRNPVSKEHYRNTDFIFLNWDVPPPTGCRWSLFCLYIEKMLKSKLVLIKFSDHIMSFRLFLHFRIYKKIIIICHMDYINKLMDIFMLLVLLLLTRRVNGI